MQIGRPIQSCPATWEHIGSQVATIASHGNQKAWEALWGGIGPHSLW